MKEQNLAASNIFEKSKDLGINPARCWEITNDYIEDVIGERSVFSHEQEALDFLKDLIRDPSLGAFESKKVEGVFLSYADLQKIIDKAHQESKEW